MINMLIPKIIHQFWVGGDIPKRLIPYMYSWKKYHSNWEVKFWTEDNIPELINQEQFDTAETYSEQADILQYEVLYKYGGIVCDCDLECHKNIEKLLLSKDFLISKAAVDHQIEIGNYPLYPRWFDTGFVAATPKHVLIKKIIDAIPESYEMYEKLPEFIKDQIICPVCWRVGPNFISSVLKNEKFYTYPIETFNGQYATHHYESSWKKPQFMREKKLVQKEKRKVERTKKRKLKSQARSTYLQNKKERKKKLSKNPFQVI